MIGFDRSAFAASPELSGFGNQNVNRVNVRFMTKVFRSILSKFEPDKTSRSSVVLITKSNLSKAFPSGASTVKTSQKTAREQGLAYNQFKWKRRLAR